MHRRYAKPGVPRVLLHEVRVPLRHAERERALPSPTSQLIERILSPRPCGDCSCQLFFIEAIAPPRDVLIVDLVWDAVVIEWREQPAPNPIREITAVDQVLPA